MESGEMERGKKVSSGFSPPTPPLSVLSTTPAQPNVPPYTAVRTPPKAAAACTRVETEMPTNDGVGGGRKNFHSTPFSDKGDGGEEGRGAAWGD